MSVPPYPGEELLQCAQKQVMDKLPFAWDNLSNCFDQFMSLSEHEKSKTMDDCYDGFKEVVELHFGSLVRRLRHRLFFGVATCRSEKGRVPFPSPTCRRSSSECATTCSPTTVPRVRMLWSTWRVSRVWTFPKWSLHGRNARSIRTSMSSTTTSRELWRRSCTASQRRRSFK